MTFLSSCRRAALLGLSLGATACDVVDFAVNPTPRFEQTWNIPASGTSISVASILPNGVVIYSTPASTPPDSSAFDVDINDVVFSGRAGGANCPVCDGLNGTTAIKPAFTMVSGSSEPLPTDMISGAVIGGLVNVKVRNNLSFDPLRVRAAGTQGFMVLVVRSGSIVLGRDSVNGANTPFPPGDSLTIPIPMTSGTVTSRLAVDMTIMSPQGDAPVFINANGTINTRAVVASTLAASIRMNVVNKPLVSSTGDTLGLDGIDEGIADRVVRGVLSMSVTNPFAVAGNMDVSFGYAPSQAVVKSVPLPTGSAGQGVVPLDSADIQSILGKKVALTVGGTVNSTAPITVTPKQQITIANRLVLTIRTGGGN